jgi:ElaB/YqjD/DUF883 family membrane-anchored ribosome-binding protein
MEHLNQDGNQGGPSTGMVDRIRHTAAAQLTAQKTRATEVLGSVAAAIRQSSQPLRDNNQAMLADYAGKAADQLEQVSTRLGERDLSELMDDAKRFARRQPAVFVGAAFAAGVLAARFLKSSPDGQRRFRSSEPPDYAPATRHPGGL